MGSHSSAALLGMLRHVGSNGKMISPSTVLLRIYFGSDARYHSGEPACGVPCMGHLWKAKRPYAPCVSEKESSLPAITGARTWPVTSLTTQLFFAVNLFVVNYVIHTEKQTEHMYGCMCHYKVDSSHQVQKSTQAP